jgi:hypothetical protein
MLPDAVGAGVHGEGKTAAVKLTAKVGGKAVSVRRTITRCG